MNKIGMIGLVIAVAITGTATMSAFVVSANAQPAGTIYCVTVVGEGKPSETGLCYLTKDQCEAASQFVVGRTVCTPSPPHGPS